MHVLRVTEFCFSYLCMRNANDTTDKPAVSQLGTNDFVIIIGTTGTQG